MARIYELNKQIRDAVIGSKGILALGRDFHTDGNVTVTPLVTSTFKGIQIFLGHLQVPGTFREEWVTELETNYYALDNLIQSGLATIFRNHQQRVVKYAVLEAFSVLNNGIHVLDMTKVGAVSISEIDIQSSYVNGFTVIKVIHNGTKLGSYTATTKAEYDSALKDVEIVVVNKLTDLFIDSKLDLPL